MAGAALIVANRLPFPLDDGWKVRTWHSIRAVAEHHHVTLVVAEPDSPELATAAATSWGGRVEIVGVPLGARNSAVRLIKGLLTRKPVQYWNQQSAAAHAIVARLVAEREFSVGVAVTTFMWPYLKALPAAVPRIVDTHNVDSVNMDRYVTSLPHGPRRWYAARTAVNMRHLEREVFATASQVWVCSEEEAAGLASSGVTGPALVVPNGVDTVRFAPGSIRPVPNRLLFFGKLD
jgi:glycosyltransferase involved in cell wall biosynthesis